MAPEKADREHSGHYLTAVAVVAVAVAGLAWLSHNRTLAAAAAALGFYALHLLSIRVLLENQRRQERLLDAQWEVLRRLIGEPGTGDGPDEELIPPLRVDPRDPEEEAEPRHRSWFRGLVPPAEAFRAGGGSPGSGEAATVNVPVPRHFALGTVAVVRNFLTPEEVARVLLEQRTQRGKKFAALAVELGLLTETQREELLLAQQEGLFTDAEMRSARLRLREFRERAAHTLAGMD